MTDVAAIYYGSDLLLRMPKSVYGLLDAFGYIGGDDLPLCLDPADPMSYGSGANWYNPTRLCDYFSREGSGSGPTMSGTPGTYLSEHWDFDGSQYFEINGSNPGFADRLHQAGAKWTVMAWVFATSTGDIILLGTRGLSSGTGIAAQAMNGTGSSLILHVSNGSSNTSYTSTMSPPTGEWYLATISVDEAAGAGGSFFGVNDTFETFDGSYSSPSGSAATCDLRIGDRGDASRQNTAGSAMGPLVLFEGKTLTQSEVSRFYHATKSRFGL